MMTIWCLITQKDGKRVSCSFYSLLDCLLLGSFIDTNHFEHEIEQGTITEDYYKSNTILTMKPTEFTGKCAQMTTLWAQMDVTDPLMQDVMTICDHSWQKWQGRHLTDWAAKSLADVSNKVLDSILNESPELTLLHELTHAEAFFGSEVKGKISRK
jgi:hypothetical protein